jgi:hypothetical protein
MIDSTRNIQDNEKLINIIQLFGTERTLETKEIKGDLFDDIFNPETPNLALCGIAMQAKQEEYVVYAVVSLMSRSPDYVELSIAFTCLTDNEKNKKLKSEILARILNGNPDSKTLIFLNTNCQNPEFKRILLTNIVKVQQQKRIQSDQSTRILVKA